MPDQFPLEPIYDQLVRERETQPQPAPDQPADPPTTEEPSA